jgi:hypothetical protein
MKKILSSFYILFVTLTFTVNAQLLNGDFEQWTNGEPDNWVTNNDFSNTVVTQTTDSHSGTYALRGGVYEIQLGNGTFPVFALVHSEGIIFPSSVRYSSLTGYYKLVPNHDSLYVTVQVYRNRNIIGYGNIVFQNEQTTYTKFQVDITYYTDDTPDTSIISIGLEDTPGTGGDYSGSYFVIDDLVFGNGATDIKQQDGATPQSFELQQNYPNPFNPTTRISFTIPKENHVVLIVYNTLGQKVATLVNGIKQPGSYEVNFDGSKLSSGIYFYCLTSEQNVLTRKMILLK